MLFMISDQVHQFLQLFAVPPETANPFFGKAPREGRISSLNHNPDQENTRNRNTKYTKCLLKDQETIRRNGSET